LRLVSLRIEPCLPIPTAAPPTGPDWFHEIKHDGFRLFAHRDAAGLRLLTRHGTNFTDRFRPIVAAVAALRARSCLIDGEAIACDESGAASFQMLHQRRQEASVILCAFDVLELDGRDMRREPIEERKQELTRLLRSSSLPCQVWS
jgi:bifunctional non-homologous end joining protein LigD